MTSGRGGWSSLSVGTKMAFIPVVFIAAILVLVVVTTNALEEQRSATMRVRLAHTLRFLNQRHFKEVLLARAGFSAPHQTTRAELLERLRVLREGGAVVINDRAPEIFPRAQEPEVLAVLTQQEKLVSDMFALTDAFLALEPGDPREAALLAELEQAVAGASAGNQEIISFVVGEAAESLNRIVQMEWILAAAVLVLGGLLAYSVSRSILGPLAACVEAAGEIGSGNLAGRPMAVHTADEMGQLGDTFNHMRSSLRELLGGLAAAIETLGASCTQILAASKEQAAGAAQQAASIQETTSTMEEVGQTGNQIAERARLVAAEAEATTAAAAVGIEGVQQAARAMESIRRQVEAVAENVVVLSEKTQAVGEVIAAVRDIAERSNLLALNAAIEAAAAGEEGRSFSVVAAEMKSLAEQSREATVTVRRILEEIQRGINTSVMLTEEAVKRVEAGRSHTELAETTMHDLNQKVEDSVQAFQQITAATNQQQIGYEQVAQALRNIEQATEQTAVATRQLETSVTALNELSGRLRSSTEAYRL